MTSDDDVPPPPEHELGGKGVWRHDLSSACTCYTTEDGVGTYDDFVSARISPASDGMAGAGAIEGGGAHQLFACEERAALLGLDPAHLSDAQLHALIRAVAQLHKLAALALWRVRLALPTMI